MDPDMLKRLVAIQLVFDFMERLGSSREHFEGKNQQLAMVSVEAMIQLAQMDYCTTDSLLGDKVAAVSQAEEVVFDEQEAKVANPSLQVEVVFVAAVSEVVGLSQMVAEVLLEDQVAEVVAKRQVEVVNCLS